MNNPADQERKIQWMLAHRDLWEHLESDGLYVRDRQAWRRIVKGLKADGLYSQTVSTIDVHVSTLMNRARARIADEPRIS